LPRQVRKGRATVASPPAGWVPGHARSAADASADTTAPGPFPIVGLGASAGGLQALEEFIAQVRGDDGVSFVVVQHLDPDRKDMLAELLQRCTPLPVRVAGHRMTVAQNTVYVIPPNRDLSIEHGTLRLHMPTAPRGLRLPVDAFLRSLSQARRELAAAVILSGMGSDGALGVRAIKEHGGLVVVQDPASAKFDGMPRAALDTGLVDVVARPADMPLRISEYFAHARLAVSPSRARVAAAPQAGAFDAISALLRERTGHDFSLYKKSTVYRRVERRMAIHQCDGIDDYVTFLRANPQELDLLFRELLIGVTAFFRDPPAWRCLQERVLPQMIAARPAGAQLRAWVAGCSTGEEAYSLAIAFREVAHAIDPHAPHAMHIFATDLDPDAIARARQGCYPANIAADVSPERLAAFFTEDGAGYRVSKSIREMVVFAPQNVVMDPPFTKLDVLSCRNVLIYLGPELQRRLVPLFHYCLNPGGVLLLGNAESVGRYTELFSPVEPKLRLFRRSQDPARSPDIEFPTRHPAPPPEPPMSAQDDTASVNLASLADQLLLQLFAPAAVLVDRRGDLLYVSGRTGNYLEPPAGKVNWNIHAMAREGLRAEISGALERALRDNERVVCRDLRVTGDGAAPSVDVTVHPIAEPAALAGTALVVFHEAAPGNPPAAVRGRRSAKVVDLERALTRAQHELAAMREERQSSQEELRSANEELQSTNEELQSTNEELTTSKEEMQSLNEELQSVNAELQSKVDELSTTSNDMKNLLNSTDVATVFLDEAMRVRRFTTQATRLFKLIPGDIGRPLSDIVTDLVYPDLHADVEQVLSSLAFSEREIATADGRWYQVKIMPYRTLENVIDGVVITFNDVSRAKRLEAELRALAAQRESPHD